MATLDEGMSFLKIVKVKIYFIFLRFYACLNIGKNGHFARVELYYGTLAPKVAKKNIFCEVATLEQGFTFLPIQF